MITAAVRLILIVEQERTIERTKGRKGKEREGEAYRSAWYFLDKIYVSTL